MTYDNWKTTNPADAELGSVKQKQSARKIVTTQHYSDIWTAIEDGWDLGACTGYGKTEEEAVQDLNDQLDDLEEEQRIEEERRYYAEMDASASREDAS